MLPSGALVNMSGKGAGGGLTGNGQPFNPEPVFQAMRDEANPAPPTPAASGRWRSRRVVN